jgi:hypothetical protein
LEIFFLSDDSHAFSSTSRYGFDQDWVSDFLSLFVQVTGLLILLMVARDDWDIGCSHDFFALTFASHGGNG